MSRSPVVSIIGRPNVGKSSLFNRLIKRAGKALTYDLPGVTRDRHYGITTFDDLSNEEKLDIILIDTGGFYPEKIEEGKNSIDAFFNIMTDQAKTAIEESDLVLFVVDIREGLIPYDQGIANYIRSKKKKFWLIMNKFDTEKQLGAEIDFYNLGLDETDMFAVSSAHGLGVTALRESIHRECLAISHQLEDRANSMFSPQLQKGVTPREEVIARVALIGAPNAGKSTLLNKLIGSERALVSDIPGTTVDPIEGYFDLFFGKDAEKLKEIKKLEKNDGLLFKQYEDFRKNNAVIFDKIAAAYNLEEEAYGDTPLLEEEEYLDDDLAFEGEFESAEMDEWEESDGERQEVQFGELFEENNDDFSEDDLTQVEEVEEKPEGSFWRSVHLVDTAGIRRQKNIEGPIETESVYRSLRCITEADIVLHLVDATKGLGHQDRRLIDIALEKGKSVIVLLNKMDLLKKTLKDEKEKREWLENLRSHLPWLDFCDMVPISAKTGAHIGRLRDVLKKTIMIRKIPVSTGEINRVLFELVEKNPVVVKRSGGKRFKIKYASLIKTDPPTFLLFTNKSKGIPEHYQRYLKNGLRRDFVLDNTPIHLIFRTGADLVNRMKEMGR